MAIVAAGCGGQAPAETSAPAESSAGPTESAAEGAHVVRGKAPTATGLPSIVVLEPRGAREFPPPPEPPALDQVALTFLPNVLFVRTGQPAEFWNSDEVLHNVRLMNRTTKEGEFNVSVPTAGVYRHTFKNVGVYDVSCDVHPTMMSTLVVSDGPYALVAEPDGRFVFEDVDPGSYTATVYVGTRTVQKPIEVTGPRTDVVFDPS